jgi:hypothetical protein
MTIKIYKNDKIIFQNSIAPLNMKERQPEKKKSLAILKLPHKDKILARQVNYLYGFIHSGLISSCK